MNAKRIATEHRMAHWSEVMESRNASGLNVVDFCKSRGISKDRYYYWQRKLRNEACEELMKSATQQNPLLPGMFTEAVVADSELGANHKNAAGTACDEIKIEIPGMKIRAGSAYPPETLAALLKRLVSVC